MNSRSALIVDDSIVSRIILRKYIASIKPCWLCVEVCSGEDALIVAKHLRFDLAVLDINMPGIDGLHTARLLKLTQPNLVISILTAEVQAARAHGFDQQSYHFFEKPVDEAKARAIVALLEMR